MCELYHNGEYVKKDVSKALYWCKLAVEQGNAHAQMILGFMYLAGEKVRQDYKKAFELLSLAAAREILDAQVLLGTMYATGKGTGRSVNKAAEWFYKAGHLALTEDTRDKALTALDLLQKVAPNHVLTQKLLSELYDPPREPGALPSPSDRTSGTGWLVPEGYVATCYHVVANADKVTVIIGGKKLPATVIAGDRVNDLALLRLSDGTPLRAHHALPLAGSLAEAGSHVFTIGYPHLDVLGANPKITDGVISAIVGLQSDPRTYQVTVPVQAGNSGGPLLNMNGEVVGIVTSKLNAVAMFQWTGDLPENVNFAVKATYLRALLDSIMSSPISIPPLMERGGTLEELTARVKDSILIVVGERLAQ
jgi:S1-C subfamily serine protease